MLQKIGAIEEDRENQRKLSGEHDSGHDENDELVLIRNNPESDSENDIEMYSSSGGEQED